MGLCLCSVLLLRPHTVKQRRRGLSLLGSYAAPLPDKALSGMVQSCENGLRPTVEPYLAQDKVRLADADSRPEPGYFPG